MNAWKRTLGMGLGLCIGAATPCFAESVEAVDAPEAAALETSIEEVAEAPAAMADAADEDVAVEPAALDDAMPLEDDSTWDETADLAAETAEGADAPVAETPAEPSGPVLGAVGYDSAGQPGRVHVVASGDTLWDISDAYLGTPWVWPSIWQDNGDIANPHVIHPGDRIWITPNEMRRISAEEAEVFLTNAPAPEESFETVPAALDTETEEPPVAIVQPSLVPEEARMVRVSSLESAGLISPQMLTSAASVVGRVPQRLLMSQEDRVYLGLGESEVAVGDEFTIFRTNEKVTDPDTGLLLGYHVEIVGWVQVEETFPETSLASIRMSTGVVEEGDRIMPREPVTPEVAMRAAPDGVEGKISYFPKRRVLMGFSDFVYLNRGTLDGVEVGSPLEVYRPGYGAVEVSRDERVEVPDRVVAQMLVVKASEESAVALVISTATELELGDRFRGATQ
ncbi:MAG: LysM domain-containing protein [Myxococcota bacterium]